MKHEERIERRMNVAMDIIDNCHNAEDGNKRFDNYCEPRMIDCARRGENCDNCPMTKGRKKLNEMFGFEEQTAPVVVNVKKLTVKVGKITVNWIERK